MDTMFLSDIILKMSFPNGFPAMLLPWSKTHDSWIARISEVLLIRLANLQQTTIVFHNRSATEEDQEVGALKISVDAADISASKEDHKASLKVFLWTALFRFTSDWFELVTQTVVHSG